MKLLWRRWLVNPSCVQNLGILSACTVFNFKGHFLWCYQWVLFNLHLPFLLTLQELFLEAISCLTSYCMRPVIPRGFCGYRPELTPVHSHTNTRQCNNMKAVTGHFTTAPVFERLVSLVIIKPGFSFYLHNTGNSGLASGCCLNKGLLLLLSVPKGKLPLHLAGLAAGPKIGVCPVQLWRADNPGLYFIFFIDLCIYFQVWDYIFLLQPTQTLSFGIVLPYF